MRIFDPVHECCYGMVVYHVHNIGHCECDEVIHLPKHLGQNYVLPWDYAHCCYYYCCCCCCYCCDRSKSAIALHLSLLCNKHAVIKFAMFC